MTNTRRPTREPSARAEPHPPAEVDLSSARKPTDTPHMPHERDEAVGATDGTPSRRVQQGARDLKRGVSDTSRAPEADQAYRKLKR